jgi:hypothetical protein
MVHKRYNTGTPCQQKYMTFGVPLKLTNKRLKIQPNNNIYFDHLYDNKN